MYKKQFVFLVQIVLCLTVLNLCSAFADTIILKSGERVEGKIVEKTDQYIRVEIVEGVPTVYFLDEIEQVEGEILPPPEAAAPEPSVDRSDFEKLGKYLSEAKKCFLNEKYEDLLLPLKKAIELQPSDPDLYKCLGMAFYYSDHLKEAAAYFEKELNLRPDDPGTYLCLGIVYDCMGHQKKTKEAISKSIKQFKEKFEYMGVIIAETLLKKISEKE